MRMKLRAAVIVLLAASLPAAARAGAPLVYVTNQDDGTITVIDTRTDAVMATLAVDPGPAVIAATPNGKQIFISHPETAKVTVLETGMLAPPRTCDVPGMPFGLAADAAGRVYVGDWNQNRVTVMNGDTCARIAEINVGKSPAELAMDGGSGRLFVVNREGDSVSVIDSDKLDVIATVPVGHAPFALGLDRDHRLYVANVQSSNVSVLDADTLEPLATVKVGSLPYGVAAAPNGKRVWVTNQQSGTVSVLDSVSLTAPNTIKIGRYPEGIAVLPDGSKIYAVNWFSSDVSVIDAKTGKELKRIKAGSGARALVVVPDRDGPSPSAF